jgi:hypothetical protein
MELYKYLLLSHIRGSGGSSVVVDKTLEIEGAAADAKAAGDGLNNIELEISSDGEGEVNLTLLK